MRACLFPLSATPATRQTSGLVAAAFRVPKIERQGGTASDWPTYGSNLACPLFWVRVNSAARAQRFPGLAAWRKPARAPGEKGHSPPRVILAGPGCEQVQSLAPETPLVPLHDSPNGAGKSSSVLPEAKEEEPALGDCSQSSQTERQIRYRPSRRMNHSLWPAVCPLRNATQPVRAPPHPSVRTVSPQTTSRTPPTAAARKEDGNQ